MGTKVLLSDDGAVMLDDGRRRVTLGNSRWIQAAQQASGRFLAVPPEAPPPVSLPPAAPETEQRTKPPGRPRIPPPTMFRLPEPWIMELPGQLPHVATLRLYGAGFSESWGNSLKRTHKIMPFATLWMDLESRRTDAIAEQMMASDPAVFGAELERSGALNVLVSADDLSGGLDLGEVARRGRELPLELNLLRVFYVPKI